MPRYHFNLRDGKSEPDVEGTLLANISCARREAAWLGAAVLQEAVDSIWDGHDRIIEVTDDSGLILFMLHIQGTDSPAVWKS